MIWIKRKMGALGVLALCLGALPLAAAEGGDAPALALETLLTAELEAAEGVEVIVSRVTIPPQTALPKHWHPGEEFAYVLEGVVTLWQEGKEDITVGAGGVGAVPLRQVHTARTGAEGASLLVFRVHQQGQPERVPVD